MSRSVRARLAGLMFLQYFVMGLWAVTLGAFLMGSPHEGGLNMTARHVGLIYGTMALGATVSPLFVGLLADRLFATQRVLAALHLLGAGLLGAMLWVCISSRDMVRDVFDICAGQEKVAISSELSIVGSHQQTIFELKPRSDGYQREMTLAEAIRWCDQVTNETRGLETSPPGRFTREYRRLSGQIHYRLWPNRMDSTLTFRDLPVWGVLSLDFHTQLRAIREQMKPLVRRVRTRPEVIAAADRAFPPLFFLMLAYACCYLPTISLSNAITFRNLPDPTRQYGPVRALGTVGWVAAGLFVGFAAPAVSPLPFLYAAIFSAVLAVLCLVQPHTPPAGKPKTLGDAFGLPALRMLADRSFLVYVLTALVAAGLMPFHNSFANKFLVDLHVDHAAAVQTLAQPTEIAGAVAIPWLWARWGAKRMLFVGLVASAGRFALYASQSVPGILALGLPLHGVGFSLFFIAAALYVDRQAPPDLRASAQGLVTLVTLGAGGILGNWFAGRVVEFHTAGGAVDWTPVWLVPALGTLVAAVAFGLLFREPLRPEALPADVGAEAGVAGASRS